MKLNDRKKMVRRASSRRAPKQSARKHSFRLAVGEPWNESFEATTTSARKDYVNILLAVAFIVLLFAHTANAMVHHDQAILQESLNITKLGLIFVAVWAGGRAALRVLSGWNDHN